MGAFTRESNGDYLPVAPVKAAPVRAEWVKRIARECGFELAGVAGADSFEDFARYEAWVAMGMAGEMRYLTDRRAEVRRDVRKLLPSARSVICLGKLYYRPAAPSPEGHGVVSQYAWGANYHEVLRAGLENLARRLLQFAPFEYKICVDTAPLLERTFARQAGLGWIGRNTCLINEPLGSWFFLGELITSLELEPDSPPPDRCGTCTRCIQACPTEAIVPLKQPRPSADAWGEPSSTAWVLDARRCISYFTIELRGAIPEEHRAAIGTHIFGCDICQDVCPWNARAPFMSATDAMEAEPFSLPLEDCAYLSESQFREKFKTSPLARTKYSGFLRNAAVAMGNAGLESFREPLAHLAKHPDPVVAEHARWALLRLAPSSMPTITDRIADQIPAPCPSGGV
jgi:epoxyqueuosine reductase